MAVAKRKTLKEAAKSTDSESLWGAFWKGFFWPVRLLWKGLKWISKKPPLRQIGHGLRWFFALKPVRFIAKILGLKYLYESFRQLRTVTWPKFRESLRLTGAVIVFSVAFGLFITGVDYVLDKVFKQFLLK